ASTNPQALGALTRKTPSGSVERSTAPKPMRQARTNRAAGTEPPGPPAASKSKGGKNGDPPEAPQKQQNPPQHGESDGRIRFSRSAGSRESVHRAGTSQDKHSPERREADANGLRARDEGKRPAAGDASGDNPPHEALKARTCPRKGKNQRRKCGPSSPSRTKSSRRKRASESTTYCGRCAIPKATERNARRRTGHGEPTDETPKSAGDIGSGKKSIPTRRARKR